jgi:hypothetical protein
MLTLDDVTVDVSGMTINLGKVPAPVPETLAPMFWAHLEMRGG